MPLRSVLARIVRLVCPVCGRGPLFERFFRRAERCRHCDWEFERGEGHWVGGSEVHMFASYGLSVLICIPILVLWGTSTPVMIAVVATHVLVSLTVFRYSRAIFLGLDVYLDPARPPGGEGGGDHGETVRPRTPPTTGRRRARRRERSSPRDRQPALR